MDTATSITMTRDEWTIEGALRFGNDVMNWRFICPSCGHIASVSDYKAAGAPQTAVAFSCVGRWLPNPRDAFGHDGGPCNYAGGGLIGINPITIVDGYAEHQVFAFADPVESP